MQTAPSCAGGGTSLPWNAMRCIRSAALMVVAAVIPFSFSVITAGAQSAAPRVDYANPAESPVAAEPKTAELSADQPSASEGGPAPAVDYADPADDPLAGTRSPEKTKTAISAPAAQGGSPVVDYDTGGEKQTTAAAEKASSRPFAEPAFLNDVVAALGKRAPATDGVPNGSAAASAETGATAEHNALLAFYTSPGAHAIWVDANGLTPNGRGLLETLETAADWGLTPRAFEKATSLASASGELPKLEAELSRAALLYARHARGGRILRPTKDLSSYLDRKPQLLPAAKVLETLRASDDSGAYLLSLHPRHEAFKRLRKSLIAMRAGTEDEDDEVKIPASGPLLRRGMTHVDVGRLRKRLEVRTPPDAEGNPGNPLFFDRALEAAIKQFQADNGLSRDGLVGRRTRAAFNGGPRTVTEDMIIANMEMWRWMPDDLGALHVVANIPEYKVRVTRDDRVLFEERVIIGKTNKQTPSFSDVMEYLVFNPKWGVPNSIKVNELLPSLARGGSYFQRQNLRLSYRGRDIDPYSVNWAQADIRNYHVYQPPGPGNVLGVVKFRFPNKHQVYMHDTPTKNLFNKRRRTYSHGCVRVRDPMGFAEVLLAEDQGWDGSRTRGMVGGSRERTVTLKTPIPVHMVYQTVVADEAGNVTAFPDVYRHEERVRLALAGRWTKIPRHRDHMLPVKIDRRKIERIARQNQYAQDPVSDLFEAIFGF